MPSLHTTKSSESNVSAADAGLSEVKVVRSISDVVKAKANGQESTNKAAARKTKEERRISNRQKLLTIAKRHSGFLKRPEILETVYSVEEDGENVQQQQQQQAVTEASSSSSCQEEEANKGVDTLESSLPQRSFVSTDHQLQQESSPGGGSRRSSFRFRLDSDMTASTDDYSTDDDSIRLFYSTDECSGSCSRRSSYGCPAGGVCSLPCSRRNSYGHIAVNCCCCCCGGSCSNVGSRRSSFAGGSHFNLSSTDDTDITVGSGMGSGSGNVTASSISIKTGGDKSEAKTFNRVMSNHRSVTKPKDVKFKRINKAKSRSLEELRGRLLQQATSSSTSSKEQSQEQSSPVKKSFGPKAAWMLGNSKKKAKCASLDRT